MGEARSWFEGALAAIAARDGEIGAFLRLDPRAHAHAARLDAAGAELALHGVPVGVKDVIDTEGLTTEYGTAGARGHVPVRDAACVARLRRAGAVVVGKTVTTELAYLTPAATRNPWALGRTPGGSSSGSAAAVASGMVPLALGTQTGGSVIRPASYCGAFGFKASFGRADLAGVHPLAPSLDSLGWFADSAEMLARAGAVLLSAAPVPLPLARRPRIARLATPFDARVEPSAHALADRVARALEMAGAILEEAALPPRFAGAERLHERLVSAEAAREFARYAGALSPGLADFVACGKAAWPGHDQALAVCAALRTEFTALMGEGPAARDALLLPAATGEAPPGLARTGDPVMSLPFSLVGAPCVALPAGSGPAGLPIGVQLVGRIGEDEALLRLACWAAGALGIAPRFAPDGAARPAWRAYADTIGRVA